MALYENLTEFYDRPVKDWTPDEADSFDYAGDVPRLRLDYDEAEEEHSITKRLEALLARPEATSLTALVFGMWGQHDTASNVIVDTLVAGKARLPALEALFIGDIISEENEISWIKQSDVSPLWGAFPGLREVYLRGGDDLAVGTIDLPKLETLVIETGGLSRQVVQDVLASPLPALEHLELWLGSNDYGADTSAKDFENLVLPNFPALLSLGLCDCEYADELAAVIAKAPVVERLERLDLSMGTLGDVGAQALLASPAVAKLQELDLHYNFISPDVADKLHKLGPEVGLDDVQTEEEYGRYIAVSE
jgi:hypothetical protein